MVKNSEPVTVKYTAKANPEEKAATLAKKRRKKSSLTVKDEKATSKETVMLVGEGQVLSGRYKVLERVGIGGMGLIFRAEDQELDNRVVALKVLPQEMAGNAAAVKRLKKEAIAAIQMHHPNIMAVHAFESDGPHSFLVMEFLDGPDLEHVIVDADYLELEKVLEIARQVCPALDYAHEKGIVHRDIKPANMLFTKEGSKEVVKVADFGIAYQVRNSMAKITGQDMSAGTLHYMPPEQLAGRRLDGRTDQYALAASLYEMLCGRPPFDGSGLMLMRQIDETIPEPIEDIPKHINDALLKALSKKPENRYESCEALLKALETEQAKEPPTPIAVADKEEEETKVDEAPKSSTPPAPPAPPVQLVKKNSASCGLYCGVIAALLLLLFIVLGLVFYFFIYQKPKQVEPALISARERARLRAIQRRKKLARRGVVVNTRPPALTVKPTPVPTVPQVKPTKPTSRPSVQPVMPTKKTEVKSVTRRELLVKHGLIPRQKRKLDIRTKTNTVGIEFAWIPAGKFLMGHKLTKEDRDYYRVLSHPVHITQGFWMARHEISQKQWQKVMGNNPSRFKGERLPVDTVSWDDCQQFIKKLNKIENTDKYALPTEAQWEYACRGGSAKQFHFGDSASKKNANMRFFDSSTSMKNIKTLKPTLVGSFDCNDWGLFDMHGNVREWCLDTLHVDYYSISPKEDPAYTDIGYERVLRGGSWNDSPDYCTAYRRSGLSPTRRGYTVGFRIIKRQ